jgi:hypothetical protein
MTEHANVVNIWILAFGYFFIFCGIGSLFFHWTKKTLFEIVKDESNENKDHALAITRYLIMIRFVIFCFLFFILFISNFYFIYILWYKGTNAQKCCQILCTCIFIILGIAFLLFNNIEFIKVFENTIGYFIINSIFDVNKTMKSMFIEDKHDPEKDISYLFTHFRLNNFNSELKRMKDRNEISPTLEDGILKHFFECVYLKHMIGHLCWIYFATLTTAVVATRYMDKYV